jgi:hypothetical protein
MPSGKLYQNCGPCAICGQQNSNEKFRKLNVNQLSKVKKSFASQQFTSSLQLDDQLCQFHYNNLVVYDQGIKKKKKKKGADLSYNLRGFKHSLSEEKDVELSYRWELESILKEYKINGILF